MTQEKIDEIVNIHIFNNKGIVIHGGCLVFNKPTPLSVKLSNVLNNLNEVYLESDDGTETPSYALTEFFYEKENHIYRFEFIDGIYYLDADQIKPIQICEDVSGQDEGMPPLIPAVGQ